MGEILKKVGRRSRMVFEHCDLLGDLLERTLQELLNYLPFWYFGLLYPGISVQLTKRTQQSFQLGGQNLDHRQDRPAFRRDPACTDLPSNYSLPHYYPLLAHDLGVGNQTVNLHQTSSHDLDAVQDIAVDYYIS